MRFHPPLVSGRLIQRYRRFFADVVLDDGQTVTAHCPNTGSMLGCAMPGARVWLSRADDPRRRLAYTWELVEARPGVLVGINTARSNRLVEEAIRLGRVPELAGYSSLRREVRFGREASRIDLLATHPGRADCYVEVKNVTAAVESRVALFPDAVSRRGVKHLRELMHMAAGGARAVLFFCVQREDVDEVRPADAIDADYGRVLREALANGVEALAYRARVSVGEIELSTRVPVVCP
jgi:sugar fermentation stimulation protein A